MNETISAHTTSWDQVARDVALPSDLADSGRAQVDQLDPGPIIITITDDTVTVEADPAKGETPAESAERSRVEAERADLERLQAYLDTRRLENWAAVQGLRVNTEETA